MIHIKLFEGFSTEDYYQEIEPYDYFEKIKNKCFFSRKDIKYLMSLFNSTYPLYNMGVIEPRYEHQLLVHKDDADFNDMMLDSVIIIVSYTTPSNIGFSITPVEDDYFVINVDMFSKTKIKNNNKYYLCDQMDGLMKLFKDKGIL